MGTLIGLTVLAVAIVAVLMVSSAVRRAESAERRADSLATRNLALERAIGVAEQALRSLANDTRLDAGMAVEIDTALADVRRAARDGGPGLSD
jgi:type II secretory pathway component PulK